VSRILDMRFTPCAVNPRSNPVSLFAGIDKDNQARRLFEARYARPFRSTGDHKRPRATGPYNFGHASLQIW
jgi:hypothetical protein